MRTASLMEGPILPPQKRQRLVRLGQGLGLTAFDANLVIAIVQDQARRGHDPSHCPTAGQDQLSMVPLRAGRRSGSRRGWIAAAVVIVLLAEMILLTAIL